MPRGAAPTRVAGVVSRFLFVLGFLALAAAGCTPEIGDACVTSLDCSQQGGRLCDTSQPEGYCTVFDCQPDACPGAAVCVRFGVELDPSCASSDVVDPRWPRFERAFCLAACEADDDCREGYRCLAPSARRGAGIDLESELRDSKVCFRATNAPEPEAEDPAQVCDPAIPGTDAPSP